MWTDQQRKTLRARKRFVRDVAVGVTVLLVGSILGFAWKSIGTAAHHPTRKTASSSPAIPSSQPAPSTTYLSISPSIATSVDSTSSAASSAPATTVVSPPSTPTPSFQLFHTGHLLITHTVNDVGVE